MRRLLVIAAVLAIAGGGLYLAQRRQHPGRVSPDAVLAAAADLQRDVSRLPLRLTRLGDGEEIRIGDALAQDYAASPAQFTPELQAMQVYISQVGARLAAHAQRRLPYHFHLVPSPYLINAFAIPGGHVFIGLGLLHHMKSEDELAFVLGHEIEHIDHYHAAEKVQIEARLRSLNLEVVAALAQIPMALWQAGYAKDQELEADREGLRLAVAGGYSPQGALDLLNRFLDLDRQYIIHAATPAEEMSQAAIQGLEGYFRSHPETAERVTQAQRVIVDGHLDASRAQTPLKQTAAGGTAWLR